MDGLLASQAYLGVGGVGNNSRVDLFAWCWGMGSQTFPPALTFFFSPPEDPR